MVTLIRAKTIEERDEMQNFFISNGFICSYRRVAEHDIIKDYPWTWVAYKRYNNTYKEVSIAYAGYEEHMKNITIFNSLQEFLDSNRASILNA